MGEGIPEVAPTLADQVSRLYDLVAGYHATHLVEVARELGVWEALSQSPGLSSDALAERLGTNPFYVLPIPHPGRGQGVEGARGLSTCLRGCAVPGMTGHGQ